MHTIKKLNSKMYGWLGVRYANTNVLIFSIFTLEIYI